MSQAILDHRFQLLESAACLAAFFLLRIIASRLIRSAVIRSSFKSKEEGEVARLINLLLVLVLAVVLTAIWGVKQSEILLFATSVITVLGVAFFAEMSILSNVTACLVLFFQHPVKIGDTIRLRMGEQEVEGELIDITYFFTFLRTAEGKVITVPNAALLKNPFTTTDTKRA